MAFLILLALIGLAIIGFSAYAISQKAYRSLLKKNENTALIWSIVIFLASFGLILFVAVVLLLSNLNFGR
jgi:cell division protein FtsW (lipid II flippase)